MFAYASGTHSIFPNYAKRDLMMHARMVDGWIRATEKTGSNFVSEAALALHLIGRASFSDQFLAKAQTEQWLWTCPDFLASIG